jgi:hypothetical protein
MCTFGAFFSLAAPEFGLQVLYLPLKPMEPLH